MIKATLVTLFVIAIPACEKLLPSSNTNPIYPEVIFQSIQCGTAAPDLSLKKVGSQQHLDMLMQRLDRNTLGNKRQPYPVNFKNMNVLFLEIGNRPTTGYGLSLSKEKIRIKDGEVIVKADWIEPPEDSMQAQVITSPCLIFLLSEGDYSKVTVDIHNKNIQRSVELR